MSGFSRTKGGSKAGGVVASVGAWDGDTFVIRTSGFNDRSWLDAGGTPHTEALKTTERLRRSDFGHMEIESKGAV